MNPAYLGDSYDIVKRFFCDAVRALGYSVYVDPMYTGAWTPTQSRSFLRFLGAQTLGAITPPTRAALLIDPDTGIRARRSSAHVSFEDVVARCRQFSIVIVFDQSFSRGPAVRTDLVRKLGILRKLGVRGVYFDSHARFLICGSKPAPVMRFQKSLTRMGLPRERFVGISPSTAETDLGIG
jgi:hypothetical protein